MVPTPKDTAGLATLDLGSYGGSKTATAATIGTMATTRSSARMIWLPQPHRLPAAPVSRDSSHVRTNERISLSPQPMPRPSKIWYKYFSTDLSSEPHHLRHYACQATSHCHDDHVLSLSLRPFSACLCDGCHTSENFLRFIAACPYQVSRAHARRCRQRQHQPATLGCQIHNVISPFPSPL